MRILKKLLLILLGVMVIIIIAGFIFHNKLKPSYEGTMELSSLNDEVKVYYDDYGVPHIYAKNELDAIRTLGYVHAQDRLWQMELIRRIAVGRLSELFGEKTIKTDKFFASLGIEENTNETVEKLDKNSSEYQLANAYLDGVNQFIEKGATPIEFYLLGITKEKYTINDIYNVYGYMAFSFAHAHKTDPLLTEVKEKLGNDYLKELDIIIDENSTLIKNEQNPIIESKIAAAVNAIYENLPISPFIGSNSWVIGPEKTKNGKVIFANDPHIGFAQPSVWYQSHIVTPEYEMYGYNLALTPFPLLGHNRKYAYGLTMFENDDLDFYFEENDSLNANKYRIDTTYQSYKVRNKVVKVKDADSVSFAVKVSRHGPIMNDVIDNMNDERPIAMDWVYTQLPNKILQVNYMLSHANSLKEFKEGASLLHAPGLNIMYGDSQNNIAWFASGKLYKFNEGVNPKLILDGASGTDERTSYLDFSENPQAINPSWHYVYSANNQPDSIAGMLYPGYYLPEDRAKRIVSLLEAKNDFTKEDVMQMINDVTSSKAHLMGKEVVKVISEEELTDNERKATDILNNWDGNYNLESNAPTIYNRVLYEILANTYKDELGTAFKQFTSIHLQKKVIFNQVYRDSSVWWDDVKTVDSKETRKDVFVKSFKNAISFLENQLGNDIDLWTWNKVHTVEFKHPIGEVAMMRGYFNVGPFEIEGGNEVINNQIFTIDSTGYYKVNAGPSTRRVIDFSDIENSMSILPTGQSGNPGSDHYADQAEKYVKGEFVKMMMNEKEIKTSKNVLIFKSSK